MKRRMFAVAVAVALLSCAADDDDAQSAVPDAGAEGTGTAVSEESNGSSDPADETPQEGGRSAPAPAGEPLVAVEHPVAEFGGTLDIELRADEVGELLRVALTFIPRDIGDEQTSVAELLGSPGSGNGMWGRLIDPTNLLEYESVRPAVPHGQSAFTHQDQSTTLYFYFAAPVEPFESFDFLLDFGSGKPNWQGVVDVPFEAG